MRNTVIVLILISISVIGIVALVNMHEQQKAKEFHDLIFSDEFDTYMDQHEAEIAGYDETNNDTRSDEKLVEYKVFSKQITNGEYIIFTNEEESWHVTQELYDSVSVGQKYVFQIVDNKLVGVVDESIPADDYYDVEASYT